MSLYTYVNRKCYPCIYVQVVFSPQQYRLLNTVARWPGSVHNVKGNGWVSTEIVCLLSLQVICHSICWGLARLTLVLWHSALLWPTKLHKKFLRFSMRSIKVLVVYHGGLMTNQMAATGDLFSPFQFWLGDKWVPWEGRLWEPTCYTGPVPWHFGFWPSTGLRV